MLYDTMQQILNLIPQPLVSFIKLIIAASIGAYINHFFTSRRAKRERDHSFFSKQLHQIYAPLLIQVFLLKTEIESWENIQRKKDEKCSDSLEALRREVNAHHIENIISLRQNILNLLSDNYGLISEKKKNQIMSFLKATQSMSLIKSSQGYFIFIDEEKSTGSNPLCSWKASLDELRNELDGEISSIKEKLKLKVQ